MIVNGNVEKSGNKDGGNIHLEFERLVPQEAKPAAPAAVPHDYLLSRTQSTSGIATKRALELKKKYLLGPQATFGLQKSDSASQLDSKFKTFHSHISECQKLLNPAPDISPSMQAFLDNSTKRNGGLLSPTTLDQTRPKQLTAFNFASNSISTSNDSKSDKNSTVSEPSSNLTDDKTPTAETIVRPTSPLLETSIVVPDIPWKAEQNSVSDVESDSLISDEESSSDDKSSKAGHDSVAIPRVEIRKPCGEVMQLDSLMIVDGKYIGPPATSSEDDNPADKANNNNNSKERASPNSDSGNDITAFFTDNEALDWAVDIGKRSSDKSLSKHGSWEMFSEKDVEAKKPDLTNILAYDHSDIDFMDTGSEESLIENLTTSKNRELATNRGFVEFVDINTSDIGYVPEAPVVEAVNRHLESPVNDRSMDFIEQGAYILENEPGYYFNVKTDKEDSEKQTEQVSSETETKTEDIEKDEKEEKEEEKEGDVAENENIKFEQVENEHNESNDKNENVSFILDNSIDKNDINLNVTTAALDPNVTKKICNSPKTLRKLEEITKEKVKQKDVIHQMVMDKMSKTTLNSEKRLNRRSRTSISPECFGKKSTPLNTNPLYPINSASDVKLILSKDESGGHKAAAAVVNLNAKLAKHPNNSEAFSLPDLPQAIYRENQSPSLLNNNGSELTKRPRGVRIDPASNEMSPFGHHGGIVPGFRQLSLDDCSGKLVQDVKFLRKSDVPANQAQSKSSGNLYTNDYGGHYEKKGKKDGGERRKSIIKTVSDFFKRRDSTSGYAADKKNRLPKDKYKSKEQSNADENLQTSNLQSDDEGVPPPVPPLPTNIGQFSGESQNIVDPSMEQHKSSCLLAFERNEKIKKTRYNLKILEAKQQEKRMQYEIAKASAIKRQSNKNRIVMEQLLNLKYCVEKLQFQIEIETFLLEDLRLEEQYSDLRLKLMKPLQSKRAKINKDMMDIFVKRQCLANNLKQITRRYFSREPEADLAEALGFFKEACSENRK